MTVVLGFWFGGLGFAKPQTKNHLNKSSFKINKTQVDALGTI